MLDRSGVPSREQVLSVFPSRDKLISLKAVIECYEEIPCNPCETYCPFDAITIGERINNRPLLSVDKCVGCGICVSVCPGVAIMLAKVVESTASFTIAYEFYPLPKVNETWLALNRSGEVIGEALVTRVTNNPAQDHSALISVECPKELLYEFVSIRRADHE